MRPDKLNITKLKQSIKIIFVILLLTVVSMPVTSQFIIDDDSNNKDTKVNNDTKKSKLPPHIAFNIKAVKVENMNATIKITWSNHPQYVDQFIIGRSNSVIDSKKRALKAKSIKIVAPKSKGVYIDTNLKAGKYYYVVLAKDKVKISEVELYQDVNYTSLPVIIDETPDARKKNFKMMAKDLKDGRILITYQRMNMIDVVYTIYRAKYMLDTIDKIRSATAIGSVVDKNEFIDSNIPGDGKYFYAYTVPPKGQDEILQLTPDRTFITEGVNIFSRASYYGVSNIKTSIERDVDIRIAWSPPPGGKHGVQGFAIYRYDKMISDKVQLHASRHVVTVDSGVSFFIDKNPDRGKYYYAVLTKFNDGKVDSTLRRDYNFSTSAVVIGAIYEMRSIMAKKVKRGILVLWDYTGEMGDKKYRLFRANRRFTYLKNISEKYFIRDVNITEKGYLDVNPPTGKYYYGIVPFQTSENLTKKIVRGINITQYALNNMEKIDDKKNVNNNTISNSNNNTIDSIDSNDSIDEKKQYTDNNTIGLSGSLNKILRKTYYKGEYKNALRALKRFVQRTSSKQERARAKLFIGKTYVEQANYKKALRYFIVKDVMKYFPKESSFWKEYSIIRIR